MQQLTEIENKYSTLPNENIEIVESINKCNVPSQQIPSLHQSLLNQFSIKLEQLVDENIPEDDKLFPNVPKVIEECLKSIHTIDIQPHLIDCNFVDSANKKVLDYALNFSNEGLRISEILKQLDSECNELILSIKDASARKDIVAAYKFIITSNLDSDFDFLKLDLSELIEINLQNNAKLTKYRKSKDIDIAELNRKFKDIVMRHESEFLDIKNKYYTSRTDFQRVKIFAIIVKWIHEQPIREQLQKTIEDKTNAPSFKWTLPDAPDKGLFSDEQSESDSSDQI